MVLGICDKDADMRQRVREICEKVLVKNDVNYRIKEFENGNEVLEDSLELTVLLMEVDIPGTSGIQIKKQFERDGRQTCMIFVSDNVLRMQEAFGLNVHAFVKKSEMEDRLPTELEKVINKVERFAKVGRIDSRDIVLIKVEGANCRLFLENGKTAKVRLPMNTLEKVLQPAFFVRIHRSLLVNMSYIDRLDKDTVTVREEKYLIAARRRSAVRKSYEAYCLDLCV